MRIKIYSKSVFYFTSKQACYAFIFEDEKGVKINQCSRFKTPIKTPAHADCAALVNSLHILSMMEIADKIEILDIYSDSKVVREMIQGLKFQAHCHEAAKYWQEIIKPRFKALKHVNTIKIDRNTKRPNEHNYSMRKCEAAANKELDQLKLLTT